LPAAGKLHGLASSLAEIEALKGLTSEAACDIVVRSPFTPIENPQSALEGSPRLPSPDSASERRRGACTTDGHCGSQSQDHFCNRLKAA
jgi:triosephosphate isomerase (TIM)